MDCMCGKILDWYSDLLSDPAQLSNSWTTCTPASIWAFRYANVASAMALSKASDSSGSSHSMRRANAQFLLPFPSTM